MAQPAVPYYDWQLEVILTNMQDLGIDLSKVILLFTKHDDSIPKKLQDKYGVRSYVFKDTRPLEAQRYIPSIRPWLWFKFLSENPEYTKCQFVYQDSDIIYRDVLDFNKFPQLGPNHWYGADVESYVGPDYINSKGTDLLAKMQQQMQVKSLDDMWAFKGRSIGAQWIIDSPNISYWKDVYESSYRLYSWFNQVASSYDYVLQKNGGSEPWWIQTWCAEMYAELYICAKYNIITEASSELEFSWSTDPISRYNETKIMHNAGVTEELYKNQHLFYKGKYINASPLNKPLDGLGKDTCSYAYVQAIKKVR